MMAAQKPAGPRMSSAIVARPGVDLWQERVLWSIEGRPEVRSAAYPGGCPGRVSTALEEIERRSRGRNPLRFTVAQHDAAVHFEDLAHRVASGNVKLSRLDGNGGGGSGLSVTDAMLISRQRFDLMLRRIGSEPVLAPRGAMAMPGRRTIGAGDVAMGLLVWRVTQTALLQRFGWGGQTRYVNALNAALGHALDAIYGV